MKIFLLPDLGEGLAEAEIREWYVKVGDEVQVDQPLASMETAKAVVDVPSPYAGKILQLHGKANEIIKTGAPLVSFDVGQEVVDQGSVVGKLESSEKKWEDGAAIIGAASAQTTNIKAMPAARVLAKEMNIDLSTITGTGPQNLITVEDVKQRLGAQNIASLPGQTEMLHGVRRAMALTMAQSHQEVVPVTIIEDADITHLTTDTDLTVRLLQALVAAAKQEPALNAWFDGKTLERQCFSEIHVGLAMDSEEGLFVPVLKDVAAKTPAALRQRIDEYKVSVRTRSIASKDMQGATIILSNFGTITGRYATPIVVPPMVAILGCGRMRAAAVVHEGQLVPGRLLPLSLTFDHRAVTGGEATRFLGAVIQQLTLT